MDDIPKEVLIDCAHLVKANSIQGNTDSCCEVFVVSVSGSHELLVFWTCLLRCSLLNLGSRCHWQLLELPMSPL